MGYPVALHKSLDIFGFLPSCFSKRERIGEAVGEIIEAHETLQPSGAAVAHHEQPVARGKAPNAIHHSGVGDAAHHRKHLIFHAIHHAAKLHRVEGTFAEDSIENLVDRQPHILVKLFRSDMKIGHTHSSCRFIPLLRVGCGSVPQRAIHVKNQSVKKVVIHKKCHWEHKDSANRTQLQKKSEKIFFCIAEVPPILSKDSANERKIKIKTQF